MPGQRFAALDAAEDEVRVFLRDALAQRAVADPDEARFRALLLEAAEDRYRQPEILLRGDAADMDHRQPACIQSPCCA